MPFVPAFEGQKCSLGYAVVDWLTAFACHGPGDAQGDPLDFSTDPEVEDFLISCYELNPVTGRRLYQKAVYSAPKGRAKSETAGLVGVAESLADVRFDGWDANGQPVGRPVRSPFVRCLATEETQAGNTFANIAFIMGEWGQDSHPEIYGGIRGIGNYQSASNIYLPDGGELRKSTAGAASKDGGKETFLVPDEIHLYVLPELRDMYATALRNTGKRRAADPWALITTTACLLGQQSTWEVVEKQWKRGELGPEWLVHHRGAKGRINIADRERTLAQLREVYGPAMHPVTGWMDAETVYSLMRDPTVCRDEQEAARYYLNRSMSGSNAWIPQAVFDAQVQPRVVQPGEAITLGFDGSISGDTTVLQGCAMSDGYRFRIGLWDPAKIPSGKIPRADVLERIRWAHRQFRVVRGYYDPHEWRSDIQTLATEFTDEVVVEFPTNSDQRMHAALDRLHSDLINGLTFHDDDKDAREHYGNAYATNKARYRLIRKEYPNSPRKIDTVVGDALAYQARSDAMESGWDDEPTDNRVFCFR